MDMVLRWHRMENLRGGDWDEIQNSAHRVSMHSRCLFSVVFMCLISPTQKLILGKSTTITKAWGKSRFDEILDLWIFILDYFVALAFWARIRFFFLLRNNAWQRNLKKRLLIPVLHMFPCLVSIHSKIWIQQQTSCLHQRLVMVSRGLAWFRCYDTGVSFVRQIFVSSHSEFE